MKDGIVVEKLSEIVGLIDRESKRIKGPDARLNYLNECVERVNIALDMILVLKQETKRGDAKRITSKI